MANKKPRDTTAKAGFELPIPAAVPLAPSKWEGLAPADKFYNMPTSPATGAIMDVLRAGGSRSNPNIDNALREMIQRKEQISHGTTISLGSAGNARLFSVKSSRATVSIELPDISQLAGTNKPAKKLFILALIKINEQALHNGELTQRFITFPLRELVDIGFYGSVNSARKGFNDGADVLTSLKVKGTLENERYRQDDYTVLFIKSAIKNGQCYLFVNDLINWNFIAQYFTFLPRYFFRLKNRASDLLYNIFFIARQNCNKIAERGYFCMSFRSLQACLNLPDEAASPNPDRDIRQAIMKAIEEIEDNHSAMYNNTDFSLLPVYDDTAAITDFLDNGYLKVSMKGEFSAPFMALNATKTAKIKARADHKRRIVEKAKAAALAKKIKEEEKENPTA